MHVKQLPLNALKHGCLYFLVVTMCCEVVLNMDRMIPFKDKLDSDAIVVEN